MNDELDPTNAANPTPDVGSPPADVGPAIPPTEPTPARAAQPFETPAATSSAGSLEPAVATGIPTSPVEVGQVARPSRARWAIAGLIALVVVTLSGIGLFALVGASSNSVVSAWSPGDAIVYVEVRADLPGDQRQNLGKFMAHFPGFSDPSTLDTKLDESLDKLISKASDGKHDWTKEIKPWFGGQMAISVSAFPTLSFGAPAGADATRVLAVISQKDPLAAKAWLASIAALSEGSDQTYKGVTITTYGGGSASKAALAVTDGVLLFGDETSVKAAIDRDGKDGLAAAKAFNSAMAGLNGEQVTRTYVDFKGYFKALTTMTETFGGGSTGLDQTLLDKLPAWVSLGGRIESDALVGQLVEPAVDGFPKIEPAESTIAKHLPAATLAMYDARDIGKLTKYEIEQLRQQAGFSEAFKQIDKTLAAAGGLDHLTGWIGETAIVVTADGGKPGGGVVIVPTNVDQANEVVAQLRNLVALVPASAGFTISDEPYGAGTITTIDLGDVSKLSGGGASMPFSGHVQISYTVQDGIVVVGVGPDWVKSIVDVKAGASLADQARYRDAIARVGTKNTGSVFVDLTAIRKLVEPLIATTPAGANYATDTKPYLAPFDILAGASTTGDGTILTRFVVTVINPQ